MLVIMFMIVKVVELRRLLTIENTVFKGMGFRYLEIVTTMPLLSS